MFPTIFLNSYSETQTYLNYLLKGSFYVYHRTGIVLQPFDYFELLNLCIRKTSHYRGSAVVPIQFGQVNLVFCKLENSIFFNFRYVDNNSAGF